MQSVNWKKNNLQLIIAGWEDSLSLSIWEKLNKALGPRRHLSTLAGISCLELRQQRHREIGFLSLSISTQPAENRWVGLSSYFQAECNRCQMGKAQGKVLSVSLSLTLCLSGSLSVCLSLSPSPSPSLSLSLLSFLFPPASTWNFPLAKWVWCFFVFTVMLI